MEKQKRAAKKQQLPARRLLLFRAGKEVLMSRELFEKPYKSESVKSTIKIREKSMLNFFEKCNLHALNGAYQGEGLSI